MPVANVTIVNRLGLHARAAAKFVQSASHYGCSVLVGRGEREVNGKSIMGMMMLAAAQGAELRITTEGEDDEEALRTLVELVDNRFGEPS